MTRQQRVQIYGKSKFNSPVGKSKKSTGQSKRHQQDLPKTGQADVWKFFETLDTRTEHIENLLKRFGRLIKICFFGIAAVAVSCGLLTHQFSVLETLSHQLSVREILLIIVILMQRASS